jgi:hypothetical protein
MVVTRNPRRNIFIENDPAEPFSRLFSINGVKKTLHRAHFFVVPKDSDLVLDMDPERVS